MIELKNLCKSFKTADGQVDALTDINLTVDDGEIYGIIGMSGAGKSTLVRCINMLERPTSGQVLIDGRDMSALTPKELREARRSITMIFQQFNLLMQRNCLKNVCFPMELEGMKKSDAVKRAKELLEIVGLPDKAHSYPAQLSGGQQQRVAIARALATNPKVLLCDEATSALDPKTTHSILELIRDINKKLGITVVVITHQMSVVEEICSKVAILDYGHVVEEGSVSSVFTNPKSDAAKKLVLPGGEEDVIGCSDDERALRIVFNGSSNSEKPVIAQMAVEHGILANILSASTKTIGEYAYGSMVIGVKKDQFEKAVEYLSRCDGLTIEEVENDD